MVNYEERFNQKLGSGFFGGEGFVMQRLSGQGMALLECDGPLVQYQLETGQSMIVDTGNVLGFTEGVDLDIQWVEGVGNMLFGGEGLFNTKLTSPGTIYLQTMPLATIADVIAAHLPKQTNLHVGLVSERSWNPFIYYLTTLINSFSS